MSYFTSYGLGRLGASGTVSRPGTWTYDDRGNLIPVADPVADALPYVPSQTADPGIDTTSGGGWAGAQPTSNRSWFDLLWSPPATSAPAPSQAGTSTFAQAPRPSASAPSLSTNSWSQDYQDKFDTVTKFTPAQYAAYQASSYPPTAKGARDFAVANGINIGPTLAAKYSGGGDSAGQSGGGITGAISKLFGGSSSSGGGGGGRGPASGGSSFAMPAVAPVFDPTIIIYGALGLAALMVAGTLLASKGR